MPGKIIQALKSENDEPADLDEIDKMGNDMRSDPASAMLEVWTGNRTALLITTLRSNMTCPT
jgi:ATP-dependent Lon protease